MINPLNIALSGLIASSKKLDVAANNIANADTKGAIDPADGPAAFVPNDTIDQAAPGGGVFSQVQPRINPFVPSFDPDSPFANTQGLVNAPNVNLAEELITSKQAEQAYKANATVMMITKRMQDELNRVFDERA